MQGLLLFRSENTAHLNDNEFVDAVWPTIQEANSHVEGFSQINREMIVVVRAEVECAVTEKSSIKRGQV